MPKKRLHIFRAGTHTAQAGQTVTFSAGDIASIAADYKKETHEAPLVIGHPNNDAPAFGWADRLEADGENLYAVPHQVNSEFAEAVNAGRYKKISVALYPPQHPGNPLPGKFYLRHIGFLGGQAPSVKGLASAGFSETEEPPLVIDQPLAFSDDSIRPWVVGSIGGLFSRLRDLIIAKYGLKAADEILPRWEIDEIAEEQGRLREAQTDSNDTDFSENETEGAMTPGEEAALKAENEKLKAERAEFAEREKTLEAERQKARLDAASTYAEELADQGRILPREREGLTRILSLVGDAEPNVAFAEADGGEAESPSAYLKRLLSRLTDQVDFTERGARPAPQHVNFQCAEGAQVRHDRLELHRQAQAYAEQHKMDYADAAILLEKQQGGLI